MTDFNTQPLSPTRAYIDLCALAENYKRLSNSVSSESICVVKANAYGHSCRLCAPTLYRAGCRKFAVATLAEALELRDLVGDDAEIIILGYTDPSYAAVLGKHSITQCVFSLEYAKRLNEHAERTVNVHIKLDTGMNRIGFRAQNDADFSRSVAEIKEIASLCKLKISGLFTHFSRADELSEEGDAFTHLQFERFVKMDSALKSQGIDTGFRHACNSAGALRFPQYALDGVRFGILLYGGGSHMAELSPVMRLETEITYIHKLCDGERVGYGGRFTSNGERTIATLPIGYSDGLSRRFSGGTVLLITKSGRYECPVVGNVCMDQCMVDVTDTDAEMGDRVVLFGDEPKRLAAFARHIGTIDYECLCRVSSRVPRIAVEEDI